MKCTVTISSVSVQCDIGQECARMTKMYFETFVVGKLCILRVGNCKLKKKMQKCMHQCATHVNENYKNVVRQAF